MSLHPPFRFKLGWTVLVAGLVVLYAGYLATVLSAPYGPVDFETFREIGSRFVRGENPYGENSYYPMPFVGIFGLLALLPRWLAVLLWLGLPVAAAVALIGPWALAFGPLFAHFTGGQTAVFGMVAVWVSRRNPLSTWTGLWLALATVKPHLAMIPILWSLWQWRKAYRTTGHIPRAVFVFGATVLVLWAPWFFVRPGWVGEWLANPRGLSHRAMAGLVPRLLLLADMPAVWFWLALGVCAAGLLWLLRKTIHFDSAVYLWAILAPVIHDYDLIQLLPLADTRRGRAAALISSLPVWAVILFAYGSDAAWMAVTIIAPVMLLAAQVRPIHLPSRTEFANQAET